MILAEARLDDGRTLCLREAEPADAAVLARLIVAAFAGRPSVDPRPPALDETPESVAAALAAGFGVVAEVGGTVVGTVIVRFEDDHAWITRVSVDPAHQRHGIASVMVEVVLELLAGRGRPRADLIARAEFSQVVAWWHRHGFAVVDARGTSLHLSREIPVRVEVPTGGDMQALGRRLAGLLGAGDLLIASGDLGAGKTTLAQGIGAGLDVAGAIISPTFVLARIHPARAAGPALVHVDAYRLGSFAEVEDLDLEVSLADSVTLVEWGTGLAEGLSDDRLEIDIRRSIDPDDETRWVFLTPIGRGWLDRRGQLEGLA
ncbi:MAG TPA: tRNA (adenosine(37)-N6)-threonylcarbamoyltransferase complex ATPase subunit type 1 TsaE [Propionicimonas sp.]|jgi:tRNA threonylcarbamoyladenosine biosynthesis protein TsaE|nr:tRNA (adenosine(37)-N6)-threonylcarbamoyltransferase complex ATPase subunit type 1 TsaE [Propionicimonas sp.]